MAALHSQSLIFFLISGRLFDYTLLDMFEFGISDFQSLSDIPGPKIAAGTKPCLSFHGPEFEDSELLKRIKNMFIDFFRGLEVTSINLEGFDHHLQFTAIDGKIYVRSYRCVVLYNFILFCFFKSLFNMKFH